jgi:hypothetical protein
VVPGVLLGLISVVSGPAWAGCAAPYTTDALLGDMVGVEGALRSGNNAKAASGAAKLEGGLPCLDQVLPAQVAGRTYRAIGAGYLVGGNAGRGNEWLLTAVEIESNFEYGLEDLPPSHPVRDAWSNAHNAPPSDPVPVAGKTWIAGKAWLDGRAQSSTSPPAARAARPHLLQESDGGAVKGWLVEGNAFPEEALTVPVVAAAPVPEKGKKPPKGGPVVIATGAVPVPMPSVEAPSKAPKPPKTAKVEPVPEPEPAVAEAPEPAPPQVAAAPKPPPPPKVAPAPKPAPEPKPVPAAKVEEPKPEPEPKVAEEPKPEPKAKEPHVASTAPGQTVVVERQRPWEKTPLIIGGGVLLGGAGLLYWQAAQHHSAFYNGAEVDTSSEVLAEQSATNTFLLASGALFAVGAGTLTWGVILDGGSALPSVGWRW